MKLTEQQIATYRQQGVVIVDNVLADSDLDPVIDEINSWVDRRARDLKGEDLISNLYENVGFERRLAQVYSQCDKANAGLDIMESRGRAMFAFLFNANLLDAVEGLVGPEITCNPIQHLRAKLPIVGEASCFHSVPWHQDAAVTWEEADPVDIVTCWIPLVDATEANGCMRVLPGVSKAGYLEHHSEGGTTIRPDVFPHAVEPMVASCPKGGVVFMSKYTPHSGLPNREDTIRWSIDLRYQKSGEPTGRPFWPSFIVRSRSAPDCKQQQYDTWCRRWDDAMVKSKGVHWHRTIPPEDRVPD